MLFRKQHSYFHVSLILRYYLFLLMNTVFHVYIKTIYILKRSHLRPYCMIAQATGSRLDLREFTDCLREFRCTANYVHFLFLCIYKFMNGLSYHRNIMHLCSTRNGHTDLTLSDAKLARLPSACIRREGKPVAFEMVDPAGFFNNQFVFEEHRRKGLGTAVETWLSHKCIR
uniref:Glycine N-acyltransferase-like protein n=1 Tax=Heterorhabditis bacteriophora TaxID=37862 RepID=A0A1I7W9T8_HETBA